jgi:hypothetical protein
VLLFIASAVLWYLFLGGMVTDWTYAAILAIPLLAAEIARAMK